MMRLQLSSGCASDAISEAEDGPGQPVISGKRRSEKSRVGGKRPSGYGSRVGVRRAEGPRRIKEDGCQPLPSSGG